MDSVARVASTENGCRSALSRGYSTTSTQRQALAGDTAAGAPPVEHAAARLLVRSVRLPDSGASVRRTCD